MDKFCLTVDSRSDEGKFCAECGLPLVITKARRNSGNFNPDTGKAVSQGLYQVHIACPKANWLDRIFGGHDYFSSMGLSERPIEAVIVEANGDYTFDLKVGVAVG